MPNKYKQDSHSQRLKPEITISLVCVNQRRNLERLLPSLCEASCRLPSELLLLANRSQDGSAAFVRRAYPKIQVIENDRRAGYGENHNLNLCRARGRYFVIMNLDMTVEPNLFIDIRDYMDQHIDIGIVSPKILNEDQTIQGLNKRYPTLFDLFLRRFVPKSFQKLFQHRLDYYEMRDRGYENILDVPFLSGAFMFCRTELLRSLSGFDPGFFLYFEDVDLCRRVQLTHRTVYYPQVSVTHFWQRSSHKNWIYTYYFFKSAFRYFGKWGYKLF